MRRLKTRYKENQWVLFKKRDVFIYALLCFFLIVAIYYGYNSLNGSMIEVRINGSIHYRFSLEEDGIKKIETNGKKLMELLIDQGDAKIINSQCPLHLCQRGSLEQSGVLVCVPQKVIITIANQNDPVQNSDGIDLITG